MKLDINDHLIWTNWTNIWSILKEVVNLEWPYNLIIDDLRALLERKGFKEFSGFNIDPWNQRYSSFYNEIWFDNLKYSDISKLELSRCKCTESPCS